MARKPAALARELLRNFPKGRRGKSRRKRKATASVDDGAARAAHASAENGAEPQLEEDTDVDELEPAVDDDEPSEERAPEAPEATEEHDAEAAA